MVYQTWKGVSSNLFERAGETSRISKNRDRSVLGGGKEENFMLGGVAQENKLTIYTMKGQKKI